MVYFIILCALFGALILEALGIYLATGFEDGLKKTFEKIKRMPRFIKASIVSMPIGAAIGAFVGYILWNTILVIKTLQ